MFLLILKGLPETTTGTHLVKKVGFKRQPTQIFDCDLAIQWGSAIHKSGLQMNKKGLGCKWAGFRMGSVHKVLVVAAINPTIDNLVKKITMAKNK